MTQYRFSLAGDNIPHNAFPCISCRKAREQKAREMAMGESDMTLDHDMATYPSLLGKDRSQPPSVAGSVHHKPGSAAGTLDSGIETRSVYSRQRSCPSEASYGHRSHIYECPQVASDLPLYFDLDPEIGRYGKST